MTRGFVTIATGNEQYYAIAANLLASYRHFAADPMPFALICDRHDPRTAGFDEVVILDDPHRSYLDKLSLLDHAPFEESIFIDADCLAYRDLNDFWTVFSEAPDFAALGASYPPDYPYAWFRREDVGEFGEDISFIPDFIGGVYFIRKTPALQTFAKTCALINERHHELKFRQFDDPTDETVFSLAMAVHGYRPVDSNLAPICFYPHATRFESNIALGNVRYDNIYEPDRPLHDGAYMVHWGTGNTRHMVYRIEVARLERATGGRSALSAHARIASLRISSKTRRAAVAALKKMHLLDTAKRIRGAISKR